MTMSPLTTLTPEDWAMGEDLGGWVNADARRVYVRDFAVEASIGVHPHERAARQPVVVSIDLSVSPARPDARLRFSPPERPGDPGARDVVCYEALTNMIAAEATGAHIDYVETLAERIAARSLEDDRVLQVTVRVEKPNAIRAAAAAGVELVRRR